MWTLIGENIYYKEYKDRSVLTFVFFLLILSSYGLSFYITKFEFLVGVFAYVFSTIGLIAIVGKFLRNKTYIVSINEKSMSFGYLGSVVEINIEDVSYIKYYTGDGGYHKLVFYLIDGKLVEAQGFYFLLQIDNFVKLAKKIGIEVETH